MNRNILVTYVDDNGNDTYGWFETLQEALEFISDDDIEVNECLDTSNCREINLEKEEE